jgi:hypothetical protein
MAKRTGVHCLSGGLLLFAMLVALAPKPAEAERRPLNRSIYVPVLFRLCPHLDKGELYQEDQIVGVLPSERIFQFTYYPDLRRIEPEAVQMRVVGNYVEGGEPFVGRIALTSAGIHTAAEHIPFDLTKDLEKLRYRLDVHLQRVALEIRCKTLCSRATTLAASQSEAESEGGRPK